MTLTDFLEFAKAKAVSGILINIEVRTLNFSNTIVPASNMQLTFLHKHKHSPVAESVEFKIYLHQSCQLSFFTTVTKS